MPNTPNISKVSIITVNFNGLDYTLELLKSTEKLDYPNIEVLVVDNASVTDPTSDIKKLYPEVRVIRSETNLGFAGGNNLGIRHATGDFYFLVNNDTELSTDVISKLKDIFDKYPNAGAASPKFHYYYSPGTIEYAGYKKVNPWNGRNSMIGCGEIDNGQYDKVSVTNYAHGGGMMVPASVVQEVGLMPENYFLYYEEFDWCEQIKRKGYKIYYQYESIVYHKESMTTGKKSTLKTYYLIRNRILFMRRNSTHINRLLFFLYLFVFTVPKNTFSFIFKNEPDHLKSFWKGLYWNLKPQK